MKNPIRIIFAGGGTGGHLYSGIAVAQELKRKYPDAEILFVGTEYGLEKTIVPQEGYELQYIEVAPLKGSGLMRRLKSLAQLPKAFCQSRKIIQQFKPTIVLGIGGYASGPLTLTARWLGIKTAIIEQNAYPGFANRILGKFVHKVFLASKRAASFFKPHKVFVTGNPVRMGFLNDEAALQPSERFTIFILGGSQGANRLNLAMLGSLLYLHEIKDQLCILHQTGKADFERVKEVYARDNIEAEVFEFIANVRDFYARADLVICRSGAGTITELTMLGKPAILVPYPFAADDHQFYNAMDLVDAGCAEIIYDWDLTGERIAERIKFFMNHPEELAKRSQIAKTLARPMAASDVLEESLNMLSPV